ncbi:MAG: alpha-ribazole kinase [Firmicutes bacterium]|nr:alpha-ribazole kinase [Bacillota bacterium]
MRRRDVTVLDLPGGVRLLVACDAAGGIGPKEQDRVRVSGYVLGRFTARVALMEIVAAGGRPLLLVNTACVEPEPTGKEILAGIEAEARLAGLGPDAITGSWEKNIPTVQTGLGVTALGLAEGSPPGAVAGDLIVAIGRPKVGDEVSLADPEIADLPLVLRLAKDPRVHDLLPVGSRGIAAEAEEMAGSAGLDLEWLEPQPGWDFRKSAGPATCVLAAVAPEDLPGVTQGLRQPWTPVARLAARGGGREPEGA